MRSNKLSQVFSFHQEEPIEDGDTLGFEICDRSCMLDFELSHDPFATSSQALLEFSYLDALLLQAHQKQRGVDRQNTAFHFNSMFLILDCTGKVYILVQILEDTRSK